MDGWKQKVFLETKTLTRRKDMEDRAVLNRL